MGDTLEVQERPDMAQSKNRARVHEPEKSARQETAPEELNEPRESGTGSGDM